MLLSEPIVVFVVADIVFAVIPLFAINPPVSVPPLNGR
jgi:hypothetical protein